MYIDDNTAKNNRGCCIFTRTLIFRGMGFVYDTASNCRESVSGNGERSLGSETVIYERRRHLPTKQLKITWGVVYLL